MIRMHDVHRVSILSSGVCRQVTSRNMLHESVCRPRYHTYKWSVRSKTYTDPAFESCEKLPTYQMQTCIGQYRCNIQGCIRYTVAPCVLSDILNVLRQLIQLQCDKLVCALCLVEWRFMLSLLLQPYSTRVHTNKPSVQNNSAPAEWCDGAVCSM